MNHPILPCGYNADDNNGDEVDGAGTNWPIWPVLFDTFEGLVPLIITDEMLEVFVTECSDIVFPDVSDQIALPFELLTHMIPAEEQVLMIAGESDRLVLSRQAQTQAIRGEKRDLAIAGVNDDLALPGDGRTQVIRKVG
jgi:hypothetical protein